MSIQFRGVYKSFGSKKVLNGLNLEVHSGEILFILGRSGTGKSVALKHLVGLLKPDKGEIFLDSMPLHGLDEDGFAAVRRRCGLVFQLPALLDSRSVFENLCFGIRDLPLAQRLERARVALGQVQLASLAEQMSTRFPPELSYGEQKRIALARTLLIEPSYLLYDEPTTGLDPETSRKIHELIADISRTYKKTSVVVSHDMKNALATADRIVVLDAGQVVDSGTPEDIFKSTVELTRNFLKEQHARSH
jgi:phospholipid/cholesterol/gamma-HCH transport system ATP-binding protein